MKQKDLPNKDKTIKAEYLLAQKESEEKGLQKKIDYYSFLMGYNKALSWFRDGKDIK